MVCREYKETLSSYIDDEVKPLERLRVEAHLRGCGRCRRHLRQMRHARELLGRLEKLEAPDFAVRRARSFAIGQRARGWERLRGGLAPRPQRMPLKPVLLAGMAFLLVVLVAQNFPGLSEPPAGVAGDQVIQGETPLEGTGILPQAEGRLPGTLAPDQLSDAQKAALARRVLESRSAPGDSAQATDASAPDNTTSGVEGGLMVPQEATRIAEFRAQPVLESEPIPGVRAPGSDPVPGRETHLSPAHDDRGQAGRIWPEERPEDRTGAGTPTTSSPVVAVIRPTTRPATPEAGDSPRPAAPGTEELGRPAAGRHDEVMPPEFLDLETSYTEVLVLHQEENGVVTATFHLPESDPEGPSFARYQDAVSELGMLQGEARSEALTRMLDDLPSAPTDPETGVAPPLPLVRPGLMIERPERASLEEFLGPVALRVLVNPDGSVRHIATVSDSGLPWLDQAVERAVLSWTFRPAQVDGVPTPAMVEVVIEFEQE